MRPLVPFTRSSTFASSSSPSTSSVSVGPSNPAIPATKGIQVIDRSDSKCGVRVRMLVAGIKRTGVTAIVVAGIPPRRALLGNVAQKCLERNRNKWRRDSPYLALAFLYA